MSDERWAQLMKIKRWTPLDELNLSAVHLKDSLYRIEPCVYLQCVSHDRALRVSQGQRFVTALLWAQSDGAVQRAQLLRIEDDEPREAVPPSALLPGRDVRRYGPILETLAARGVKCQESASYRVATDGEFVQRNIVAPPMTFHFRSLDDDDGDECYAIRYLLEEDERTRSR